MKMNWDTFWRIIMIIVVIFVFGACAYNAYKFLPEFIHRLENPPKSSSELNEEWCNNNSYEGYSIETDYDDCTRPLFIESCTRRYYCYKGTNDGILDKRYFKNLGGKNYFIDTIPECKLLEKSQ